MGSGPLVASKSDEDGWTLDWTKTICRAGAIVLLVGFWFDGGLFDLATGSVFWILLELGRADTGRARQSPARRSDPVSEIPSPASASFDVQRSMFDVRCSQDPVKVSPPLRWLTRTAWLFATMAFLQTAILIGVRYCPVNRTTLAIARHWLVHPKAVSDVDYLPTTLDPQYPRPTRQSRQLQP